MLALFRQSFQWEIFDLIFGHSQFISNQIEFAHLYRRPFVWFCASFAKSLEFTYVRSVGAFFSPFLYRLQIYGHLKDFLSNSVIEIYMSPFRFYYCTLYTATIMCHCDGYCLLSNQYGLHVINGIIYAFLLFLLFCFCAKHGDEMKNGTPLEHIRNIKAYWEMSLNAIDQHKFAFQYIFFFKCLWKKKNLKSYKLSSLAEGRHWRAIIYNLLMIEEKKSDRFWWTFDCVHCIIYGWCEAYLSGNLRHCDSQTSAMSGLHALISVLFIIFFSSNQVKKAHLLILNGNTIEHEFCKSLPQLFIYA